MVLNSDGPQQASTAAIAIASALLAGTLGYFVGSASSIWNYVSLNDNTHRSKSDQNGNLSSDDDSDETDVKRDQSPSKLADFASSSEECKLVLVVRTDLGMTKGKIAAQCSHATLACFKALVLRSSESQMLRRWERQGQMKVALQVKSEEDLELLQAQAMSLGICAKVIHDAGRTQIASGSATVLGVGPAPKSIVDKVTGHLKLL